MSKKILDYTQNRELSWLRFNRRVLEEAMDGTVPLLERMKFVAIFTSNLDEFFMIRVGSLYDLISVDNKATDNKSGMTAQEQIQAIYEEVAPLYKERDKTYADIKKQLHPYGICGLDFRELTPQEKKYVKKYFKEQVLPVLSPQIVDSNHPFPHLLNKEIYVVVNLCFQNKELPDVENKGLLGIVPVPQFISDILYLPGEDTRYIRMEKIIMEFLDIVFEQYQVSDANYICVTRNADISPDDEDYAASEDFRFVMQRTLHKRKRMAAVRMEAASPLNKVMEKYLCEKLRITPSCIFRTKMPMKLDYIFAVAEKVPLSIRHTLCYDPFSPQQSPFLEEGRVMPQVKKRDILLSYPYDSMEPFLQLIKEASTDPDVMNIKITIYRLANKPRLVEYLCAAAENGKEVTVLIELRARFDEQNNIEWSERMEEAGCLISYGFEDYKVHSKICLITYLSRNQIKYITQIGTGNYNEKTARMYTDFSLLTSSQEVGQDGVLFFKNMSTKNLDGAYEHLIVSPTSLKAKVLMLMDEEILKGSGGRIIMKMNSLTDMDFIRKVFHASKAGVKVDLMVRGICCLLPGVEGKTDNVTVTSVVGRFLEHPRVFAFGEGTEQRVYIGSADMMTRNTEKRVEIACPVYDESIKRALVRGLEISLADNVKGRIMQSDGTYRKKEFSIESVNSQEVFMNEALRTAKGTDQKQRQPEKQIKKPSFFRRLLNFFYK